MSAAPTVGWIGAGRMGYVGEGSGDSNIVYVRNVALNKDYEICRSRGKYSVEVAGFAEDGTDEITHSHRPRRFRDTDD